MPHLRDGSPATIGDAVRGKPYNTKDENGNVKEVVGTILSITPNSESCNCVVGWVEEVKPEMLYSGNFQIVFGGDGVKRFFAIKTDYGETKAFEKVVQ